MNRSVIILFAFLSLTCEPESLLVDAGSASHITLTVRNLQTLPHGEGHYEAWISFSSSGISKSSAKSSATSLAKGLGVQHNESSYVSIGRFNVDSAGHLLGMDGTPFTPRFAKVRNPQYMADAIMTIEAEGDSDDIPGPAFIGGIVSGDPRVASASLSTEYEDAIGDNISVAQGNFLLATPTSSDTADSSSGIWLMKSLAPLASGFVDLPPLGARWRYEGWVRSCCLGTPEHREYLNFSTGKFGSATGFDSDSAGARKGPTGPGYPFPGQDFTGVKRMILNNGSYEVMITIEPEPDNSSYPFETLTLFAPERIPATVSPGVPQQLHNNAAALPAAKIRVVK